MLAVIFEKYTLFLLILVRMSGAIFPNHLFARKGIPNIVKVGLTAILAYLLTYTSNVPAPKINNLLDFAAKAIVEFGVGYAISLIMYMFFSAILIAAEEIDVQLGIGMAHIYDPGGNTSSAVTGLIYNTFMVLLFFVTNSHITLFKLLCDSIVAVPCGGVINLAKVGYGVMLMFGEVVLLAAKFALPIIGIQFITEIGLGVLTRAVPHVNIFSIGFQAKLIVGILMIVLIAPAYGNFCDTVFTEMFTDMTKALNAM